MARVLRAVARALVGMTLWLMAQPAGAGESLEYAVKAAFIARFPPFVTWPAGAVGPGTVARFGDAITFRMTTFAPYDHPVMPTRPASRSSTAKASRSRRTPRATS